jgi:hypothetical protein
LREELRKAVDLALAGDWRSAHEIAQQQEGDPIANWIHAVVHRMEGDLDNASYWYGQCGRTFDAGRTTESELRAIQKELEAGMP